METPVLRAALDILDDARVYLEKISGGAYCMPLPVFSGATIGQHTRHFIEFFQCIAENMQDALPDDEVVVDYDLRRRDKLVETDPKHALKTIDSLIETLPHLENGLTVWLNHTDYLTGVATQLPTSLERELHYNIEHTIHHFALIKIGLNIVAPCMELPAGFGVAPSTLYRSPVFGGHN